MNEALITFPRRSIRLTVPKGVRLLALEIFESGFFCLRCYESSEKASQSERVQISSQHERVMTESCGSDAAVKKAPYSSAALETEAADYMERHHHERDAEGRALVVHTAVLEANRIDLLLIVIAFEAERAKCLAIQPASPEESLSATVAKICATDKSIQRSCADRTFGDLGQGCPPSL